MKLPILPSVPLLQRCAAALCALVLVAPTARATWSICVVNTETGEVCVATATCLTGLDLQLAVPVLRVGQGAGAAQAFLYTPGKVIMWDGFIAGDTPAQILADIEASDGAHQFRQYGIVDLVNDPVSFTGTSVGEGKASVVGIVGPLRYACQGNVLTGPEVVFATETALLTTPGDLGQKTMAAMEAARALGGDGRCSCSPAAPTSCGVPPPSFTKSAHVATIVLARIGDVEGTCATSGGCANGTYYLDLNIIGAAADPDPVLTMQAQYDVWRAALAGHPDHILSTVSAGAQTLPADGLTQATVTVGLVDVDGTPLAAGGATLSIAPPGGGASLTTIGPVTDHGDGTYSFDLTAGVQTGAETLAIVVDDGTVQPTLFPFLELEVEPAAQLHCGAHTLFASEGADVPFVIDMGPAFAGQQYILLASGSGTAPGFSLAGGTLPLNPDFYTQYTLANPGPPLLPGSMGTLDGQGRGLASFTAPASVLGSAVGLHVDWAAVANIALPTPTNADGFDIVP